MRAFSSCSTVDPLVFFLFIDSSRAQLPFFIICKIHRKSKKPYLCSASRLLLEYYHPLIAPYRHNPALLFCYFNKAKKRKKKKKKTKRPPPSPHCHSLFVWLHVRRKAGKITTHSSSPQYQFTHSFWPPISALPLPPPYGWMCAIHTQKEKKEEEITQEKERTKEKLCPTFNRI